MSAPAKVPTGNHATKSDAARFVLLEATIIAQNGMQNESLALEMLTLCTAQLDKILKVQEVQDKEHKKKMALISQPHKIGNLQDAMGIGDEKEIYLKCHVSSCNYNHIYIHTDKYYHSRHWFRMLSTALTC